MSMLTYKGFKRKRYADYIASMESKAKEEFGEDINTSPRTFLGILIRLVAWFLSVFAQDLEDTYNANFIDTAVGVDLDKAGKRQGAKRQSALRAVGEVEFTGVISIPIEAGSLIETKRGIQFRTTEQVTIGEDERVTAKVEAVLPGIEGNVPSDSITEIVNPKIGVESVTNPLATNDGRDRESDKAFRERLDRTKDQENRLVFQLLNVEGVKDVFLNQNEMINEVNGLPPKSISPLVWGGEDMEVASTILRYKAGGIQSFGGTVIDVEDSKKVLHPIGFTRPVYTPIYINASLTTNSQFNSLDEARTKIIEYVGGQDEDGTEFEGLSINEDVIAFKVALAVGKLNGVEDVRLEMSLDGTAYSTDNITFNNNDPTQKVIPVTDWEKVVVT